MFYLQAVLARGWQAGGRAEGTMCRTAVAVQPGWRKMVSEHGHAGSRMLRAFSLACVSLQSQKGLGSAYSLLITQISPYVNLFALCY